MVMRKHGGAEEKPSFRKMRFGRWVWTHGSSNITAHPRRVLRPSAFGGVFKRGDRIFRVHVNSADPQKAPLLLRALVRSEPEMRAHGIAGYFGDTPNDRLVDFFRGRKNTTVVRAPLGARAMARLRYRWKQWLQKFPPEHGKKPIQRAVVRLK